ncbi:MAG: DUF1634 domain-containing protein [Elusimicrobia bacterium]|nr:DUF1634 domain-containing protein [Elusimicrobiota bacterium]
MARRLMDQEIEVTIGQLLRVGVLSSAAVVAAGGVLYLARHGLAAAEYSVFTRQPPELSGAAGIFRYAFSLHGRGLIQLGLLMLIATPIARVVFSVFGFLRERDWLYVAVTLVVLAILLYSLING